MRVKNSMLIYPETSRIMEKELTPLSFQYEKSDIFKHY